MGQGPTPVHRRPPTHHKEFRQPWPTFTKPATKHVLNQISRKYKKPHNLEHFIFNLWGKTVNKSSHCHMTTGGTKPGHKQSLSEWKSPSHVWLCDPKPARLLCPWNSPGKNTGVGCQFGSFQIASTGLSLLSQKKKKIFQLATRYTSKHQALLFEC